MTQIQLPTVWPRSVLPRGHSAGSVPLKLPVAAPNTWVGVRDHPQAHIPTPYDPLIERDPLIAAHITLDRVTNEPVFARFDYYVADVLTELRGTGYDYAETLSSYPELTEQDLKAARRFEELYGHELARLKTYDA